jgi:hypothetical protein
MLTTLFNAILRTGIFLDRWKVAQIILIPKPGKKTGRNDIISTYQSVTNHVETTGHVFHTSLDISEDLLNVHVGQIVNTQACYKKK